MGVRLVSREFSVCVYIYIYIVEWREENKRVYELLISEIKV